MRLHGTLAAALLLCACATAQPAGQPVAFSPPKTPPPAQFQAEGSLVAWGNSVSYDAHRIVGQQVDISLQHGDEWIGSMYERPVRMKVGAGVIEGMGDKLVFTRDGDVVHVEGRSAFRPVRITIAAERLVFRDGTRSYDLKLKAPGCLGEERAGCVLKLIGTAEKLQDAPMPQFALALLAVFPFHEDPGFRGPKM